ncbi:MAG: hypothetical protein KDA85_17995 [Planctomycetaceae bacterium]|nr:hypothetical protein [Planctomycetaceae bacterium]
MTAGLRELSKRAVWVVVFDNMCVDVADAIVRPSAANASHGDKLRAATFFRRCLSNHVQADAVWSAPFGSLTDFEALLRGTAEYNSLLVTTGKPETSLDETGLLFSQRLQLNLPPGNEQMQLHSGLRECLKNAEIVWWNVACPSSARSRETTTELQSQDEATHSDNDGNGDTSDCLTSSTRFAANVIAAIQDLRRQLEPSGRQTTLILTAGQGGSRQVSAPFTTRIAADRIHVPLIVETDQPHPCFSQQLCCTRDVLPTIRDLLNRSTASALVPADSGAVINPSTQSMSLLAYLAAPSEPIDRRLFLRTDTESVVCTSAFLAILPDDESSADQERRLSLYVQPDDYWCIHDVSSVEPEETARMTDLLAAYCESR